MGSNFLDFFPHICTETSKVAAGILLTALWNKIIKILKRQILIKNIYLQTLKPLRNLFQTFCVKHFVTKYYFFNSVSSCWEEYWHKSSIFPVIQENSFFIPHQKSESPDSPFRHQNKVDILSRWDTIVVYKTSNQSKISLMEQK